MMPGKTKQPTEIGLPSDDLRGSRVLFNEATSTVIVAVWDRRGNGVRGRVFARPSDRRTYSVLGSPSEDVSDVHPITCAGPYALFVRNVAREGSAAFDSGAVICVDLRSPSEHRRLETQSMKTRRQFVAELLAASSGGEVVHAVVGNFVEATNATEYWVARIEWGADQVSLLTELEAVYA